MSLLLVATGGSYLTASRMDTTHTLAHESNVGDKARQLVCARTSGCVVNACTYILMTNMMEAHQMYARTSGCDVIFPRQRST